VNSRMIFGRRPAHRSQTSCLSAPTTLPHDGTAPLFSCSYKSLFPQLLSFHIYPNPRGVHPLKSESQAKVLRLGLVSILFLLLAILPAVAPAQTSSAKSAPPTGTVNGAANIERAIDLAAKGRCDEALPPLRSSAARILDKQLKYRAAMAAVRCAMSLDQRETAVQALLLLNRDFPTDLEVLYFTTT